MHVSSKAEDDVRDSVSIGFKLDGRVGYTNYQIITDIHICLLTYILACYPSRILNTRYSSSLQHTFRLPTHGDSYIIPAYTEKNVFL